VRDVARWYYDLLLVICLAVAGISIADLVATEVRRRRKEIGVCLAVGWQPGHVVGTFVGQAAMLGLVGGLAGSACALGLLRAVTGAWPGRWPAFLIAGIVLALVLSVASALWPAQHSIQMPPAEAMRGE